MASLPIIRVGDYCSGHEDWVPRPCIEGSPNVFVNGRAVHRIGDAWAIHCREGKKRKKCHPSVAASASSNLYANGRPVCRRGDRVACGSTMVGGSVNVSNGEGE